MMPRLGDGAARHVKRVLLVAAVFAVVAVLNAGSVPILRRLFAAGWIAAEHYHVFFAGLCILPAAAAHGTAAYAGARGVLWWTLWLPGIAVYAAFPWQQGGTWQALWIFGHALDWARTIFLHWDTAPPFVFNSFGAFATMLTIAIVACGRIWIGTAKALDRKGGDVLAPDGAEGALPSAAWASRREMVKRFSEPGGIVLGELTDPAQESPNFSPERPRSWGRQGQGQLITMSPTDGNGHVLVTSQASGYKSTGLVIPNILTYDGPLVVFDPKCELYARTRKAREAMEYTPVLIDARHGFDPARLIATLAADHPSAYLRMAKMVIPKGHGGIENSAYFKSAAINLFTALLAYYAEKGSSNILQDIARVLARSANDAHGEVEKRSKKSELPFVRNQLGALKGMDPKFYASVKTEITNQLMFSEMPDIEKYITMPADSKLPSQVIDPRCDIFLNVPQHVAEDFAPMLRLMLGSMLTAAQLIEVNEAPSARRLFLIDEAAKLGNMDILENIRDRGRSLGLHLMMFYQTPGEIERLWGRAGMTSWRDGCSATVMGPVSSRTSAQDLSAMIGTRTLRVRTESRSSSNRVMSAIAGSVSTSEQEQLRDVPLMSPTAISQLPRHASIISVPGEKPMRASKAIWFTREDMKDRVRSTEEIEDELDVTGTREALAERLAEMTQAASEAPAAASLSRSELEARQVRNMDGDPDIGDGKSASDPGGGRSGDSCGSGPSGSGTTPRLSEQAKAKGPRYGRPDARQASPGSKAGQEGTRRQGQAADGKPPSRTAAETGDDGDANRAPHGVQLSDQEPEMTQERDVLDEIWEALHRSEHPAIGLEDTVDEIWEILCRWGDERMDPGGTAGQAGDDWTPQSPPDGSGGPESASGKDGVPKDGADTMEAGAPAPGVPASQGVEHGAGEPRPGPRAQVAGGQTEPNLMEIEEDLELPIDMDESDRRHASGPSSKHDPANRVEAPVPERGDRNLSAAPEGGESPPPSAAATHAPDADSQDVGPEVASPARSTLPGNGTEDEVSGPVPDGPAPGVAKEVALDGIEIEEDFEPPMGMAEPARAHARDRGHGRSPVEVDLNSGIFEEDVPAPWRLDGGRHVDPSEQSAAVEDGDAPAPSGPAAEPLPAEKGEPVPGPADEGEAPAKLPDGGENDPAERSADPDGGSDAAEPEDEAGEGDAEWPEDEHKRFVALVQDRLSFAEIAEELGRSEASVRARDEHLRARGLIPDRDGDETGELDDGAPENQA